MPLTTAVHISSDITKLQLQQVGAVVVKILQKKQWFQTFSTGIVFQKSADRFLSKTAQLHYRTS